MKIAVMGAGAMGGYIGGRLAQAGLDVTFIARGEHLAAIRAKGLQVDGPDGTFTIERASATDDPAEIGPVGLVLFCVKSYDVLVAAKMAQPMVGPETVVIPIQNGIGHIEILCQELDEGRVLGGLSLISADRTGPGVVQHNKAGNSIEFGEIGGGFSHRCREVEQALAVEGLHVSAHPNILERMWWKLAAYSGVGVFCLVRGDRGVIWQSAETKALYHQAVAEAVAVAQVRGIPLADSVPEEHISILDSFPPEWEPSELVAIQVGRPLELEALQGAICSMGREAGVPTPINDVVYACLKPYIDGWPCRKGDA
jgi:2-dehydropantoate 2-reductase